MYKEKCCTSNRLKVVIHLGLYDTTFYIVTCFRKIHNLFQRSLDFYLQFRKNKDNKEVNFPFLNVDYKVKMADHDLQNGNKMDKRFFFLQSWWFWLWLRFQSGHSPSGILIHSQPTRHTTLAPPVWPPPSGQTNHWFKQRTHSITVDAALKRDGRLMVKMIGNVIQVLFVCSSWQSFTIWDSERWSFMRVHSHLATQTKCGTPQKCSVSASNLCPRFQTCFFFFFLPFCSALAQYLSRQHFTITGRWLGSFAKVWARGLSQSKAQFGWTSVSAPQVSVSVSGSVTSQSCQNLQKRRPVWAAGPSRDSRTFPFLPSPSQRVASPWSSQRVASPCSCPFPSCPGLEPSPSPCPCERPGASWGSLLVGLLLFRGSWQKTPGTACEPGFLAGGCWGWAVRVWGPVFPGSPGWCWQSGRSRWREALL